MHCPLSIQSFLPPLLSPKKFSVGCKGNLRSIAKSLQTENSGLYLETFQMKP